MCHNLSHISFVFSDSDFIKLFNAIMFSIGGKIRLGTGIVILYIRELDIIMLLFKRLSSGPHITALTSTILF